MLMSLTLVESSCNDEIDQIIEKEIFAQSVQLPDTVNLGQGFEIEFQISVSGCWTYSRLEKEMNQNTTSFKIFIHNPSTHNPEVACPTGFFTETIKEQIILTSLGSNDLLFNDSTLLKKIFVTN